MHLAQAVETAQTLGSNSTLLGALISGTLIATLYSAYKFVVNFRTTERGMARQRIKQAAQNERSAQHEASLWQQRSADLEYIIRTNMGRGSVPELSDDLKKLIAAQDGDPITLPKWEDAVNDRPAGEPGK